MSRTECGGHSAPEVAFGECLLDQQQQQQNQSVCVSSVCRVSPWDTFSSCGGPKGKLLLAEQIPPSIPSRIRSAASSGQPAKERTYDDDDDVEEANQQQQQQPSAQ